MALAVAALLWAAGGAAAAAQVSVFPLPGSSASLPGTQITFRGIPAGQIGSVQVVGSKSGSHTGQIEADSDGRGGSFLPDSPFTAGETVTVRTSLNVLGGHNGSWQFTVATPWGNIGPGQLTMAPAGSNGVQHFRSRPDLEPASVTINGGAAPRGPGDIFVAPQAGPIQNGPMLMDRSGNLIWFDPLNTPNMLATDFRVQQIGNRKVLTWWQGFQNRGSGRGEGVIMDSHYHEIATVQAANGLQGADLHEFLVTRFNRAYIIAASPLKTSVTSKPLMDSVIQEIDIKTGLVLFEWHSFDHIPLSETFFKNPANSGFVYDPYHANSISITPVGDLIVSMRNTWGVYRVNHESGRVMWTLGTSNSSFSMGKGTGTAFQHDAVIQPDGSLTIFDDGAGPPQVHSQSRAIRVALDTTHKTATLVKEYDHSPAILSWFEGSAQVLPGGDMFVGWGSSPYFSEFNSSGGLDFDARFTEPTTSYRAYRFPWTGSPDTKPDLAVSTGSNGTTTVYASWNGATKVASWRVLAGSAPNSLSPLGTAAKRGFETAISEHSQQAYFAVQALDSRGRTLATSAAVHR